MRCVRDNSLDSAGYLENSRDESIRPIFRRALKRERRSAGQNPLNAKRVYRLMKKHGVMLSTARGTYTITGLMPGLEGQRPEYRIKQFSEDFERVALENELSRA